MSINSCTINCSTIDAICSQRRQIIIDDLLDQLPQGNKAHQQKVNANFDNLRIFRHDRDEEEDTFDASTLEQPQIAVTVEFNGQTFTHNMDRGDENFIPLINVYGLSISSGVNEEVIISDLKVRVL
jgi:hypothetical protein